MAATWTTWTALLTVIVFSGCGASYLQLCNFQKTANSNEVVQIGNDMNQYPLDQCACSIRPQAENTTSKSTVKITFDFTTPNKDDGQNNQSCTPVIELSRSNTGLEHYACAVNTQKASYKLYEQLRLTVYDTMDDMGNVSIANIVELDTLTFSVYNPRMWDVSLTMEVKVYGDPVQIDCREREVTLAADSCPCGGIMQVPTKPPITFTDDVSFKNRLTAALVSVFVFLILIAIGLALYHLWWKKRDKEPKGLEKVTPPEATVGSENKGYQASHPNITSEGVYSEINNSKGKIGFTPDPDLNLNLATPNSSVTNESFVPRGSTDSGLYSMPGGPRGNNGDNPYVRANSLDQLNRSQPDIAGRPDILGGKTEGKGPGSRASSVDHLNRSQPDIAGRPDMYGHGQDRRPVQLSPAELEEMYAKPNMAYKQKSGYQTPPQPHGPPPPHPLAHGQPRMGSYDRLNQQYRPTGTSQDKINRSFNGLASSRDGMNRSYNGSSNELYATDDSHNTSHTVETDV